MICAYARLITCEKNLWKLQEYYSTMQSQSGGSLLPPILNPSTLYTQEAKRDATRIRIYNNVLQQINTKIRAVSRIPGNEKCLWYIVPEFIPGTPRFDMGDCILYLVWNLRNAGFTVDYTHPNLLYINWRNYNTHYHEQQSPWAQVLNSARQQVLTTASSAPLVVSTGMIAPASIHPSMGPVSNRPSSSATASSSAASVSASASAVEIQKRKTVLKKTTEYKPLTNLSAIPSVEDSDDTNTGLSGTLSSRHVSFV
jgi:hypothetical protein